MRKKILRTILLVSDGILVLVCVLILFQTIIMLRRINEGNKQTGQKIGAISEESMSAQAMEFLLQSAKSRAYEADEDFADFFRAVNTITDNVTDIYLSPERYGDAVLETYYERNMGNTVTYAAYGDGVDPYTENIRQELALIANMQGVMKAFFRSDDSMSAIFFQTGSGIFLCTEKVSEYNLQKDGELLYFEGRERPWYKLALESGKTVFTDIIEDADSGEPAISCASPVYINGVFKGVAGAGLKLDTVRAKVDRFEIGKGGYACIINDKGQVLFSGSEDGELKVSSDPEHDLRKSDNVQLAGIVGAALDGKSDVVRLTLDEGEYFVGYSPMTTVGWTYLAVLPAKEVMEPAEELLNALDRSSEHQREFVHTSVIASLAIMGTLFLLIGIISYFASVRLSHVLTEPVTELTKNVRKIEGDNLDFSWEMDTGDEVQTLAESFGSMTERMKSYIDDITRITAEKERIGAELSVAARIQAAMLPSIFPPFPEREEIDIYARMTPAKEVGGDFYDFFFVDDRNLAIVMADVSGKGVPAALFMVVAKTLIKNISMTGASVGDVLRMTNERLCEGNSQGMFVTAWLGIVDLELGRLRYADAGHENPYIMHEDGNVEMILPSKKKLPLAAMEVTVYPENEVQLKQNDMLFLYTDGVPEATNSKDELYTTERLERVLRRNYNDNPEELLAKVRKNVDAFVKNAPQFDDLTMLALRIKSLT
ncbi:MAG: SpoIIE family protein phosphatase [Lachnospiraceae bacterium]|nr:SpoIIE family protein phosphatase [Lachnospiraceae bacterium]